MKLLKNIVLAFIVSTSSTGLAASATKTIKSTDYYTDTYEVEDNLLFKIRGFYGATAAKAKNLPAITKPGVSGPGKLAEAAYGFDTAMTIFVTDNIAAEVSIGLGFYKTRASALTAMQRAYGTSVSNTGKKNHILMVPVTLTAQYHIAPYGGVRPYIGGGYNGTYMFTRSNAIKVSSGHGPVVQAGIDFISKDDTLFTFDVRQYFLNSKVTFKKDFLKTPNDLKTKIIWNPLVISAGIGFKF